MKLLALYLTNVRKFTGKRASITGIGSGITVVSEANEFGKSTFFDAIHALFFEKFNSTGRPVKSLRPYAGGAVEVAADIETDQGQFRVEKRFLSKKAAKISRLSDRVIVAQDDEAERWISAVLGSSNDGPAGLLWVRQGLLGLEADSAKEKTQLMETRRDLLSSVAGEIDTMTGGRRMDRVMHSVAQSLAEIATKTGRKTGPWKVASDEVELLDINLAALNAQVHSLETALSNRKQAETALKRLENPDAKARRETALVSARSALDDARAHVSTVQAARQERDLAVLHAKSAQDELDVFLKTIDTLEIEQNRAKICRSESKDADLETHRLRDSLSQAKTHQTSTFAAATNARKALETAHLQITARKAKAEAAQIAKQIAKAETALGDRDTARAKVSQSKATPEWLGQLENAHDKVSKLTVALEAQTTTLSVDYNGNNQIIRNGTAIPANKLVMIEGETLLDLIGIGQLTIHAKSAGEDVKMRLALEQDAYDNLLKQCAVSSIFEARKLVAERMHNEKQADLAQVVFGTLAPDGIDALRTAKTNADLAAAGLLDGELAPITELETRVSQTAQTAQEAEREFVRVQSDHAVAREHAVKLRTTSEAAEQALQKAENNAGDPTTRDEHRAKLLREQAVKQAAVDEAETALNTVVAAAPDLGTAMAELKRAEQAVATAQREHQQVSEHLAALSSEIRTLAGNGIEERRDEMAGELEAARLSEARFAKQAAALSRLQSALNAERDAARDTYFGPVQEELKPLLSILHQGAALNFDSESLLPTGLIRDEAQETLDDLSGGTKEQIAILTRLAFARLFARQGRHMPIILDDALVYSDDDRIIKMFTALTRVAQDQQIIVFSCRQLAFQDLGGARPTVVITDV